MYVILTNKIFHPHNALINLDHWIVVDSFYCMAKRISNGDIQNLSLTWAILFPHTFKTNPGFVILFSNMHLYYQVVQGLHAFSIRIVCCFFVFFWSGDSQFHKSGTEVDDLKMYKHVANFGILTPTWFVFNNQLPI